jgi:hypothetical protein
MNVTDSQVNTGKVQKNIGSSGQYSGTEIVMPVQRPKFKAAAVIKSPA